VIRKEEVAMDKELLFWIIFVAVLLIVVIWLARVAGG